MRICFIFSPQKTKIYKQKNLTEPTSLPVSERLRFFTNLTEAASRSASSSYTRSPSQRFLTATDRCGSANSFSHNNSFTFTPRSSYNGGSTTTSSASVTPTPMECCSPPLTDQQQLISINEIDSPLHMDSERHTPSPPPTIPTSNAPQESESSTFINLTKSSSQTLLPSLLAQRLARSAPASTATSLTTSPSSLTPVTRRIKMKTIGKLLLPHTFLNNERNSLQNISNNTSDNGVCVSYAQNDTCENESGSYIEAESKAPPAPLKKIGKIKSPFIENCLQMQQKHHQNSKCMKYDHKSTPHNALAALENNVSNGMVGGGGGGGERDVNSLPPRKPLQNGNAGLPPPSRIETNEDGKEDSGKENNYCDTNVAPLLALSPTASSIAVSEQLPQSPVVEMRKKFTRIMSNSTLSTVQQRHTAHLLSACNSNNNGNAPGNDKSVSSAPTTPRNSIIDDKFAKYFGLAPSSNQHCATTTTNNKAINVNQQTPRAHEQNNSAAARSVGAKETYLSSRSATNYPPLPPPDFIHTPSSQFHVSAKEATDAVSLAMETNVAAVTTPHEAINHNVRSNSNTPYYTPPSVCAYDITLAQTSSATTLTNTVTASAVHRRRDMSKRQRPNTTSITFTPTSSNTHIFSAQANADTPNSGRMRALRSRALTLTHGVPLPEVKRFEDIVVTKEEFQLASKEFERIFLGVI